MGFILALLALGVLISFRIFSFPDVTAEGSITLGAAVSATLLVKGMDPLSATLIAVLAGMMAGTVTGILHTRFKINGLLSGILVMTALYSINLHVMGRSNMPLLSSTTFVTWAERASVKMFADVENVNVFGWDVSGRDLSVFALAVLASIVVGVLLYLFFRTDLGTAMRATGDNAQMVRAMGISDGNMIGKTI